MPLNATRLKDALVARYNTLLAGGAQPSMDACLTALADEVVKEIRDNITIVVTDGGVGNVSVAVNAGTHTGTGPVT